MAALTLDDIGMERNGTPDRLERDQLPQWSQGMDGIREFLSAALEAGLPVGNFRGLLHIAIGRKITRPNGQVVSAGVTWRELAAELKGLRFDPELVHELGADPAALVARDRERFWYAAIALAKVDSPEAVAAAEKLSSKCTSLGFVIGPSPAGILPTAAPVKARVEVKARPKGKPAKQAKKKK